LSRVTTTEPRKTPAGAVHPRLRELLENDELDWDDERHREMYLKAWIAGSVPRFYEKADA
jgi:hypothetical protein